VKGYDYAQEGAYFVTICVQGRSCLLGEIADGVMALSAAGEMVAAVWHDLPLRFPSAILDEFVCMPNHIHFIVALSGSPVEAGPRVRPASGQIRDGRGQTRRSAPTGGLDRPSLPGIVQWYKSMTTAKYRQGVYHKEWPPYDGRFWQRNYYEKNIRNERQLNALRNYVRDNPAAWKDDALHPTAPQ
jgi:REP element-mobilizing transposase RayT